MKLCLAVTPSELRTLDSEVTRLCNYYLTSFFYFSKIDFKYSKFGDILKPKFLIIDSGAHTLQKEENEVNNYIVDNFVDEYIKWLKKNYDYWDVYVELDIDNRIGYERVKEIRQYMQDCIGDPPMPVWHGKDHYWKNDGFNRTIRDFKDYCKIYPYVGLSGATPLDYLPAMLDYAHKNKTQVHGFAFTSPVRLFHYNFDSVDSTSWMQSFRFGSMTIFDGTTIKRIQNYKAKKKDLTNESEKGTGSGTAKFSFQEWCKFQYNIELYWALKNNKMKPKGLYI